MRILVEDYEYEVSLGMTAKYPEIYVKNMYTSEPGYLFEPGFSIDEVEGLVDFLYSVIDKLDNKESLESLGNSCRLTYIEWSG